MHAGQAQPELAAAAIKAVLEDDQKCYRVTLRSACASGKQRWTQYEMWRVWDNFSTSLALLVSTLNATHQRELELQLESAKDQLVQ